MKRRGFLGFLAGGAVAAPALAQQAVNSIGQVSIGVPVDVGSNYVSGALHAGKGLFDPGPNRSPVDQARHQLTKLAGRSAARIAWEKQQIGVHVLDADIASMRSLAMHAKIRMQRERQWQRSQQERKSYLERVISGFFNEEEDGPI